MNTQTLFQDPFITKYQDWMSLAFTRLKPNIQSDLFPLIQEIYRTNPSVFFVIGNLHQNDDTDRLHFSVELRLSYFNYRFHIYGYWKNGFKVTDISYIAQSPEVKLLADFRRPPIPSDEERSVSSYSVLSQ